MFGIGKKKKTKAQVAPKQDSTKQKKRLQSGLSKTRHKLGAGLSAAILGKKKIDENLLEELETVLLTADIGVAATQAFLEQLRKQATRKEMKNADALLASLKEIMLASLRPAEQALVIEDEKKPYVIMMVGVNGAGKTTTTGKLAKKFQAQGKNMMLAAADTFRAAAVEQLQVWGERNNVPVMAQSSGADSAAVCFDAISSAKAKGVDVLLADTAGRLHTQAHLMDELSKVKRVMQKVDDSAPHEVLLVLDASIGQNALQQAKLFHEAVGVTGICITKLDGTAKAGIIFAIVKEMGLPIRYIGVGEQIDDLREFCASDFVEALFQ